ncbi:hypothetical protein J4211_03725 [Candidatus Woesearchaeota archaeon]|nr:hypothetical protein [Candidatus Woesearchaeota archaeon]
MTVTIDEVTRVSAEQVRCFVNATGDNNNIHQGESPVIPCIQLALLAKRFTERGNAALPSSHCRKIEVRCKKPLRAGDELTFYGKFERGDTIALPFSISTCENLKASITLTYQTSPSPSTVIASDERRYRISTHQHLLTQQRAYDVGIATNKETHDWVGLALGSLSYALLEHGAEQTAAKAAERLKPVYLTTEFNLRPVIMRAEDPLEIIAASRETGKNRCLAKAVARVGGEIAYYASSILAFVPEDELARH